MPIDAPHSQAPAAIVRSATAPATARGGASDGVGVSLSLLEDLLARARAAGADDADVIAVAEASSEVRVRRGDIESSSRSEAHEVGLRVFVGDRSAIVSSNDLRPATLQRLCEHAVAAARLVDPDPESRIARNDELAEAPPPLPLHDEAILAIGSAQLVEWARRAEQAAQDTDARIVNTEGCEASAGSSMVRYLTMGGVLRERRSTSTAVVAVPIAKDDAGMEVDYWYGSARRLSDLPSPEAIGRRAAERALRRLGGRMLSTRQVPVVFEAPVASALIADFISALSGERIARKSSYLEGRLGSAVAHTSLTLVDDPLTPYGPGARSFDGEGFAARRHTLVQDGVLVGLLTHLRSAARLGVAHGRNATRGVASAPGVGPSQIHVATGSTSLPALLREVGTCLLVTATMGHGSDLIRGQYSQGASGLWVEGGAVQYPVHELTVAGDLDALLKAIVGRADDLDPSRAISSPSLLVEGLVVAGAGSP